MPQAEVLIPLTARREPRDALRRPWHDLPIMRKFALAVTCAAAAAVAAAEPTPLLDYALSHPFESTPRDFAYQRRLAYAEYELKLNPPPEKDCATTLGARRFSALYDDLAASRSNLADYEGAAEAYRQALACTPRLAYLHAALAAELLHLNRYVEARAIAERGLEVDESEDSLLRILAQLDYIEEHWSDAQTHLRAAVEATEDDDNAAYWQCFLWLAQRRSGIARPQLVSRDSAEHWPLSILETLTGGMTETDLLEEVEDEDEDNRRREILAEALYYIGQRRLADGDTEEGRRYLAATVNLKVHYFIEHHLALAELAKMRAASR